MAGSGLMMVENVLRMKAGDGEASYANNSYFQKKVILQARTIVEDTIRDVFMMCSTTTSSCCYTIADLGCASGSNTLLAVSEIIDTIHEVCKKYDKDPPLEYQVFLNDLPENDFNSIFKHTPAFCNKLKNDKGSLGFISGVPGSFYNRLFPTKSLSLVHSSSSLHWLSQVPNGLQDNKGRIFISKSSPPSVYEAYIKQFQKDFSTFLSVRAEELLAGGRMLLQFNGRNVAEPYSLESGGPWELVADILLEMAAEGIVEEADIHSFNMPYFLPYKEEVKNIIQEEGSFDLHSLETMLVDPYGEQDNLLDNYGRAKLITRQVRAFIEPMLASHFGETIINELFVRWTKHVADLPSMLNMKITVLVISLKKK